MTGALTDEPTPGIHRISVPTPFAVGPVNCYLIEGSPLTLVDTGPNSGTSIDLLERGLAELGVRIEDLELVVVTHQHMDHEGLLEIIARRSGADLAAFALLDPWLAEYRASTAADDRYAQAVMARHGVPEDVITWLGVLTALLHAYGSAGRLTRPLADGDTLTMGDRDFSVHHRPGHSPSDLVFFDPAGEVLLAGDHLLPRISSNALVSRPLNGGDDGPRPTSLIDYASSLRATRELPAGLVLPGHGEPFGDHAELIDVRLRDQGRRARKIYSLVSEQPMTAHQIAQKMWGAIALKQAYLTLSEVLGHIDLLLADGSVTERERDGVSIFSAA